MNPERWKQIKDLFQSAMDVEPERRAKFVTEVCGDDTELRMEVESLLAAEDHSDRFIHTSESARRIALHEAIKHGDPMVGRQIGSYRIERLLGHGGMGTVYFATGGGGSNPAVAIKMVSRGMDTATVIKRFQQEQQILANLDHPNIARLYDGGTSDEGLPYFVMEFVEGQPIDVYCEQRQLSIDDRLRLFLQVCAAADSAHEKLIVHRDIKPSNILVTPDGKPKLLDFGIAKIFNPERGATLTMATRMMTPDYASPEQVLGERVTPATDVYALGILLYELLTGKRPYRLQSHSSEEMARVVCQQEAPKPSTHRPLPSPLDDIALKALRKEPGARYQTAAELANDIQAYLDHRPVAASRDSFRYHTRRYLKRHGRTIAAVFALLVLSAGITVAWRWSGRGAVDRQNAAQSPATSPVKPRPSIAVLGFKNLSNRSDAGWLSTALSEMFTTELAAGGQLRTVRLENVSRLKLELAVNDDQSFSKETFSQFRKTLGADFIVDGSYLILDQNGQLRVDLRVSNAQDDVVLAVSETGPETDLFSIVSNAGSRLRGQLGLSETAPNEVNRARAAFPKDAESVRLYTEGLARLRVFDAISALPLLQKAAEHDPQRPLVYSAMAEAWSRLGYDGKATETAKRAYELTENFSRGERLSEDRLSIEGRYRESQKDWEKAIDVYKTLWRFFPDDAEYGLKLAAVQVSGGKGKDALITVQSLRQLPAPISEDPRIDMAEGDALGVLSDFKQQLQAYSQAEKKARTKGARLLLAGALVNKGRALFTLGQSDRTIEALREAQALYKAAGDRAGIAATLNSLGSAFANQSNIPLAIQTLEQSLAISREIGDRRTMGISLNNLAIQLKDLGRFSEAAAMHEQALSLRREIGDRAGAALSLNGIGVVLFEQDRFSEAAQRYEESLQICRDIGDRRGIVRQLHNLAIVKRELGDLAEAHKMLEESLALRQQIGDRRGRIIGLIEISLLELEQGELASSKRNIEEAMSMSRDMKFRTAEGMSFYIVGELALAGGDFAAARRNHETALAIRKEMREDRTVFESLVALANLALDEDRVAEAAAKLAEIQSTVSRENTRPAKTMLELMQARVLLRQNKIDAAVAAMSRAKTLSAATQRTFLRTMVEINASRLQAAQKQPDRSLQHLAGLLPELEQTGAVQLLFETRLAQCEVQLQAGQKNAGRACSVALAKDSGARGFKRVASKAQALVQ